MPIYLANDKFRGLLRGTWISSPPDTNLLVNALPDNMPTLLVAGYGTDNETVFSVTGSTGTNASNYVLTGVTRLRGANINLPENTTLNCIAVEEFMNQYSGVASTAEGIANLIFGIDSGSNDTYEIALSEAPVSYVNGLTIYFKANTANTGAATLEVNDLGPKNIKKFGSGGIQDLTDGDIQANQIVNVVYDGTQFLLIGNAGYLSGDLNLTGTTPNITVGGADPKRAMYVPAAAMYPSTTAGCAPLTQVESSSNKVNVKVLDFDGASTAKEYAEFGIQSPSYWDASTVLVQFVWLASAGSGTVNWEIQGGAFSDDDALDAAYGTLQEVTDTVTATGDVHVSAETSAVTIAGTPVAGDWLQFRVARDPANDTNTSDARLLGVRIKFGVTKYTDA